MRMDKYDCPHPLEFSDTLSLFDLHGGMQDIGPFDCGWEINMAGASNVAFYFRLFETTMNATNHGDKVSGDLTLRYDFPVTCNEWDNRIQIESEVAQVKLCGFSGVDVPNDFLLPLGDSGTFRLRINMRDYSAFDQATIQWKADEGTGNFLEDSVGQNWMSQNTFAVEVGIKGAWGDAVLCEEGHYVCGMFGQVSGYQMTGVKIQCCSMDNAVADSVDNTKEVLISSGQGSWIAPKYCVEEAQHVCGVKTKYSTGTDGGITGIDMSCCGPSTGYIQETFKPAKVVVFPSADSPYDEGTWKTSYTNCDFGNYVCGLQARYHRNSDELHGLKIICCKRMASRHPMAPPTSTSYLSSVAAYNAAGYLNHLGF
jgi:hypothetical protein